MQRETQRLKEATTKKDLFEAYNDDASDSETTVSNDQPIWLTLATKKHMADKARLKPGKLKVPHSLNKSPNLSVCLITTDPQRAVKDAIADPSFPKTLSSRITKVIGYSKLKARYHSFESRRQLLAEHDIFLADDRIILQLVATLGKTFYKATAKRPVPIAIAPRRQSDKQDAKTKARGSAAVKKDAAIASPVIVAQEIERTLNTVPISMKPGASIAIRVGWPNFSPEQLAENVRAVVDGIVPRFIAKGWRNVKSIHIKGPNTAALPIWHAPNMWTSEDDIQQEEIDGNSTRTDIARKDKRKIPLLSTDELRSRKKLLKAQEATSLDNAQAEKRKARLLKQKAQAVDDGTS